MKRRFGLLVARTLDSHPIYTAIGAGAWLGGWLVADTVLLAAIALPVALSACWYDMRKKP